MRRRHLVMASGALTASTFAPAWAAPGNEPGISGNQIVIGSTLALSGILAGAGNEHTAGIQAAFKAANASGGIAGRELKLQSLDDGYVPARTSANVKRLIDEQSVFALMSTMGTGNTAAVLPAIEAAGLPLIGPVTGAASLRRPDLKQVFHVRASYRDEITRLMQQMTSWGLTQVGLVYLDNPFGKEVLADAQAALAQRGIKLSNTFALAGDGGNGEAVAAQVVAARPAAVVLATTGTANTRFLMPFRAQSPNTPVAGLSVSLINSELPKLGKAAQGVALTQVIPDATSEKTAMVRKYRAAMRAAGAEAQIGGSSLEGWINAQVLLEGLRRAAPELRRDRLRSALAGLRRVDLGDFSVGYSGQGPHVASQFVDLAVLGQGGKRLS